MQPLVIDSKLSAPDCGKMIFRKRLIDLANIDQPCRLKLISADAGYGKTILMGQLFDLGPSISIWYQLDKYDSDFSVFISYLSSGIRFHIPDFGEWIDERLNSTEAGSNKQGEVLHAFVSELASKTAEPVYLYLDDYHLVRESRQVREATRFLIGHLHDGCQVIIGSRERPVGLSLGKLKAQSSLVEVSKSDLRFTVNETELFFRQAHLSLDDQKIAELHDRTDGWAVALALSGNLFTGSAPPKSIAEMLGESVHIHD